MCVFLTEDEVKQLIETVTTSTDQISAIDNETYVHHDICIETMGLL